MLETILRLWEESRAKIFAKARVNEEQKLTQIFMRDVVGPDGKKIKPQDKCLEVKKPVEQSQREGEKPIETIKQKRSRLKREITALKKLTENVKR